jgi:hypothetical protein
VPAALVSDQLDRVCLDVEALGQVGQMIQSLRDFGVGGAWLGDLEQMLVYGLELRLPRGRR